MGETFRRARGMTLVEVVVALAIVVAVSVSVLSALVYATATKSAVSQKTSALLACENIINCLRTDTPSEALALMYGDDFDAERMDTLYATAGDGGGALTRESFIFAFSDGVARSCFTDGCDFYISFDLEVADGAILLHTLRAAVNTDGTYTDSYSLDLPILIYSKGASADE